MSNSSVFEIEIRDAIADALTEMLKRERSINSSCSTNRAGRIYEAI